MKFNTLMASTTLVASMTSLSVSASLVQTINFEDNTLAPNTFFNPQVDTTFTSGGVTFQHDWNFGCCWGNFTYSNRTDTTTPGFTNDRSAITGSGASGSDNYGVSFGDSAFINFGGAVQLTGAEFTNTTYAYLSMLNGDTFAKQFEAGDFYRLTINGLDASNTVGNSVTFSLAEGTNLLNSWMFVDLSLLGTVHALSFSYSSSDVGAFGINTPQYFAIDNIAYQAVPLPAAGWLFASTLICLLRASVRKQP